ncbi:MAG: NPCBM/NEW2 domain-containing protein [Verrucomicrobiota bacterium]
MRVLTVAFLLSILSACPLSAQSISDARAILDAYHLETPTTAEDRKLHLICWRANDTEFPANQQARMQRMMTDIQLFYADEMERLGWGRRTINLDLDSEGKLKLHHAVGAEPEANYGRPDGGKIKAECWPVLKAAGIDPDRETVMIFTNLSSWDEETKVFRHKSPYYAGGNAKQGTAWQLDSPQLDSLHLTKKRPIIDDGEYGKISLGKHNSIFIGGIAHELGHALGLPHCRGGKAERPTGTALMGSGNRTYRDELRDEGKGTFLSEVSSLRLASHPQFSGSQKGLYLPAKAQFTQMKIASAGDRFTLTGTIESPLPIYAIIGYLDPEGRGDYDSHTTFNVPDTKGNFTLECADLVKGNSGQVRLFALMVNGSTSKWSGDYSVKENGNTDITPIQTELQLQEFTQVWSRKQYKHAKATIEALPEGQAKALAQTVLTASTTQRLQKTPTGATFPLSKLLPTEAQVGWGKPTYDYLPRSNPFLRCSGRYFETGIYAHSPARHLYQLGEHDYQTLTGHCGVPNGAFGTVGFEIKVDGETVFQSGSIKPNQLKRFKVNITNARKIELIVTDADNNPAGDWGVWFAPTLEQ